MTSLDKAKNPSASSEGPEDLTVEQAEQNRLDTPAGGISSATASPSNGDARLHLQNAHFGALQVRETQAAPPAEGQPQPNATPHNGEEIGVADEQNAQTSSPAAQTPLDASQEMNAPAPAFVTPAGSSHIVQGESLSSSETKQQATPPVATGEIEVLVQQVAYKEDENEAPTDIELSNMTVAENAAGAVIGTLKAIDPDAGDTFNYKVSDDRFEIVDGQLKLKDGIALDHEGEPSLTISITVTDSAGHAVVESFTISVLNVNETPADIALSNVTVAENAAGAVVGTLSTLDPDAGDIHTYTVSDDRFEVVGNQLKLKDGVALDHEAGANVTVQVTSTDAGGLSTAESFTIKVQDLNERPTDITLSNTAVAENAEGAVIGTLTTADPDAGNSHTYSTSDNRFEVVYGQLKLKDGIALNHEAEPNVTIQVTTTDAGGFSYSEDFTIVVTNVNEGPADIALSNTSVAENAAGAVIGTLSTVDLDAADTHQYTVSDDRFEVVNGQLKLKDGVSLNHEAEPNVTVQVTTTDAGGLSYSEDFTIAVTNVNEGPADIALSNTTVAENAAGAVIGTLSTVDPDAADSHTYTLSDNRFEVVDGQLKLKDGVALDHEAEPNLTVQVTTTDAGGLSYTESFTITVENVNEGPSDIELSNATVAENAASAVIGTLSTVDPDAADTHQYAVSDARFEVVGGQLKLKDGISLDHESEPNLSIEVTTTDAGGLSYSETFAITVENVNEGPADISLSNASIPENAAGAIVGTLTTADPDAGDSHTYSVSDNRFEVVDGQLKLKDGVALDHEAEPNVTVQVTTTDAGGLSYSEDFTINVTNVNEGPSDIGLSNATVAENAAGAVIGALTTIDPDAGDSHIYSVSDDRFEVVDGQLKLKDGVALDHEGEPNIAVQVTTTDAGGLSYSETFTITVENVNEGPSDIELSNATVAENAAGAVIGTLSTVDPDAGDSHKYSVSDDRFEVVDGQLKLKDGITLDHEFEPNVSVEVTTTDAGGLSYSETFKVTVENVNEGPSDIALSNATVAENAAGAVIGTLSTVDPDAGDSHKYSVSDDRFEVVDGQLKLKDGVTLDHESEPNVSVEVTTTDAGGLSFSETFSITVENVNEGPSDIELSNATVAENAAGALIGTLSTVDPDAGDNHKYTVSDDRFEVVDGQLKLKDGVALDHEAEPGIKVEVTTTDAGGLSYSETFAITVENVNEGPSDIELSNATVAENAAGAVIGTLSTVDPDAGDSHKYSVSDERFEVVDGQLKLKDVVALDHEAEPSVTVVVTTTDAGGLSYDEKFSITVDNVNEGPTGIELSNASVLENEPGAVIGKIATVDPDADDKHSYTVSDKRFEVVDGQLKLRDGEMLDRESEPNVTIVVTTTDAEGLSYDEKFSITVENVNERPVDIELSNAAVAENAAGAVIGKLATTDPDAGDKHSYTVSDKRFEVVEGQLKLREGVSLDHESTPSVSVQVTTTDAGGLSYSENFSITVKNVNERPTDITLSNTSVSENASGAVIGKLATVDPDAGNTHTYTVSDSRFEVVGGQLKLKAGVALDYEKTPSVSLSVTTTDAGGLSYSEDFTIAVTNVNENPIDITLSNSSVAEYASGAVIGKLATVDPDAGNTHTYTVSDSRFEVVGGDLKLKTGVSLNYEATPSITLSVTTTDTGGLTYSESFTIGVTNVNEIPTDIALSNTSVAENAAGAVIGNLSTVDPDAGNTHTYTVSDSRFEVVGGQLKLKAGVSLNYEATPSVTLSVTTTDGGGLSYSENFTIAVTNVNENPTDIALSNSSVAENAAGAVIGNLSTVDPDAGNTHTYTVSDSRFEVVGGQLKLKTGVSLNYEATPSVTLSVTTTDAGGLSYSENFTISITNVNENPTDIALSNSSVAENAAGAVVGNLSTVDPDAGSSHTYTVSDSRFEVVSGQLKLKAGVSLNYEATPSVTLSVTTTDAGGLSYNESFTINVTNVNEAPTDVTLSNASVSENAAGAVVGTLTTADPDAASTHTYTVSDTRFEVVSGQLKLKTGVSLDYETTPSITLNVTATDAGGLSVTKSLIIAVNDALEAINGTTGNDTLNGTANMDLISGLAGNDTLNGNGGDDVLVGGAGIDTMNGGAGSDTYRYTTGDGFDTYQDNGTSGTDRIVAMGANTAIGIRSGFGTASGIEEISSNGFANVSIQGDTTNDTLNFSTTTLTGIVKIDGGNGNDTITGSVGNDTIYGGAGNDRLSGGNGNDTIVGGTGNDTLAGDTGIDTLSYEGSSAGVTVNLGANTATGGHASGDTISGFENVTGSSFADTLYGSSGANVMSGGDGNDHIRFGLNAGSDTSYGGAGIDFIQIDTASARAGWMEAIASGSKPPLASGDWLLQLDTGETYVLHGSGATYDFGGVHAGVLTGADGSQMQFNEFEGVKW